MALEQLSTHEIVEQAVEAGGPGMSSARKKLIEVALPLEAINSESAREKSIRHGHPSTLHLWWARRPLASCRAVLFASIVDDPSSRPEEFPTEEDQERERQRLFRIIEELVKWENSTNETVLEAARDEIRKATYGNPPPVLDPFCGGGSIPLEAQRLGLETHASDLNPVAVLITKALVEIPPKFAGHPPVNPESREKLSYGATWKGAQGLAEDVRYYGRWMREEAFKRIGYLYPKAKLPDGGEATVIAWLWARTVKCPNPACGAQMPLVTTFQVSKKRGKETWIEPIVGERDKTITWQIGGPSGSPPPAPKVVGKGRGFRCIVCSSVATAKYIHDEIDEGRQHYELLALVTEGGRGRRYLPPSEDQLTAVQAAETVRQRLDSNGLLPTEPARGTFGGNAQGRRYGFRTFADYFTSRQLVALRTFSDLVSKAHEQVVTDGSHQSYADAVATYLALAVSRTTDYCSSLTTWANNPQMEILRNTFARQALPMTWDFAEGNVFGPSSGSLGILVEWVAKALERLPSRDGAHVVQLDARTAIDEVDSPLVCTDPPYYDNIGYADLADYFYVWLRRSLSRIYPDLFSTLLTPKGEELVAMPARFNGDQAQADRFFEEGLQQAFERIRAAQDPGYPLTLFYAFKQAESADAALASTGWDTMLTGLLRNRFTVTGTWPMRTERSGRSVAIGTGALASSIVLVCRPREAGAGLATRRDFVNALRGELPEALLMLQHGNIAPVDLAQAAIGPGMAVFSRYAKVVEADGSPMTVRTALGLINQVLDEILAEQEGDFDADTRFAVTWFEQHGTSEGLYGEADVLARAKNTAVAGMEQAGVLHSRGGKVRLLNREELSEEWDPTVDKRITVWEVAQHLIKRLEEGGEETAAELLRRVGGLGGSARALAYRLYTTCERKGWAQEALSYNALVVAWPEIARRVAGTPEAEAQQALEV
jgi:putative DNA methylase